MPFKSIGTKKAASITSLIIAGGIGVTAYLSHFVFGDDNIIEEAGEKYIEGKTGIDIDLTPSSKEQLRGFLEARCDTSLQKSV